MPRRDMPPLRIYRRHTTSAGRKEAGAFTLGGRLLLSRLRRGEKFNMRTQVITSLPFQLVLRLRSARLQTFDSRAIGVYDDRLLPPLVQSSDNAPFLKKMNFQDLLLRRPSAHLVSRFDGLLHSFRASTEIFRLCRNWDWFKMK